MTTANEFSCANCGAPHGPDDIFCENCGYDFITGSLPGAAENFGDLSSLPPSVSTPPPVPGTSLGSGRILGEEPAPSAFADPARMPPPVHQQAPPPDHHAGSPPGGVGPGGPESGRVAPSIFADPPSHGGPAAPATGGRPMVEQQPTQPTMTPGGLVVIDIAVHRAYFDTVVSEGELTFPDPTPVPQRLELAGPEIHIGRTSQGRGIHPDIDVLALNGDPAVSSRHAVLRLDPGGTMTITDVGSTNGTYIGSFEGSPITPGMATLLVPGGAVFLGAWTAMTIHLVP